MKHVRQASIGILFVLLSTAVVLGSIVMVMNETGLDVTLESAIGETEMALSLPTPMAGDTVLSAGTPSASPSATADGTLAGPTQTWTATLTGTLAETATSATTPAGTATATLTPSDVATDDVRGSQPKPTKIKCGPPPGWVIYVVRYGDTLYSLGLAFGVSVRQLQTANCMGSSALIRTGQNLWVPNVPTRTPSPAPAHTGTPTQVPSATAPSDTPPPSATPTLPPTPTGTAIPSDTAVPTNTAVPTDTPPAPS